MRISFATREDDGVNLEPDAATFLATHPPFQYLTPGELTELAESADLDEYSTGAVILDSMQRAADVVWVVRSGQVTLLHPHDDGITGVPMDTVYPGGVFGYSALLTGSDVGFTARASEPSTVYRLPGELVRPLFARPAGLAFLAEAAANATVGIRVPVEQIPSRRTVGDVVRGEPVLTTPGTSVRDAVRHMSERRSSYILIPLQGGEFGIFTDRDLRTKVVAAGVDLSAPVAQVMSAPAQTVTEDRLAATVLMDMLESGLRHMPVLTIRGEVKGVLEEADLLAAATRNSFVLRRSIALSPNPGALQEVCTGIPDLVVDLFRGGTEASAISGILSVVIDSVVRRALEFELADDAGLPRTGFAWLSLGSIARREAMPSSDVDSALSWVSELSPESGRLMGMAANVHATLDGCGLPADANGAVASKPRFARSVAGWRRAAAQWLDDPLKDRGLVMSSLLLDGRVVWGEHALHTVPMAYRNMRADHPNALRLQLRDALAGRARTRSLRDVLSRRGGTFDLKTHALTPIVNLARWGGLTVGVTAASTPARLQAAAGNGLLTDGDATILTEVFTLLQRLRLTHQVGQITTGVAPGDVVTMPELSPLNRSLLNDGVREIAAVQRRVGYVASDSGVPLRW